MSLLSRIRAASRVWANARPATHRGRPTVFPLRCEIEGEPAAPAALESLPCRAPDDMLELWRHARAARLFVDASYGQWGLVLLSPEQATGETAELETTRPGDHRAGDLIVGRFLGDSDRLLVRCNEAAEDSGQTIIVTALDPRSDWYRTGLDLEQFAARYIAAEGDKFWEPGAAARSVSSSDERPR